MAAIAEACGRMCIITYCGVPTLAGHLSPTNVDELQKAGVEVLTEFDVYDVYGFHARRGGSDRPTSTAVTEANAALSDHTDMSDYADDRAITHRAEEGYCAHCDPQSAQLGRRYAVLYLKHYTPDEMEENTGGIEGFHSGYTLSSCILGFPHLCNLEGIAAQLNDNEMFRDFGILNAECMSLLALHRMSA